MLVRRALHDKARMQAGARCQGSALRPFSGRPAQRARAARPCGVTSVVTEVPPARITVILLR